MTRASDDPSSSGSLPLEPTTPIPRILVVEENDDNRRELVTFFTECGWQVDAARTLHDALEIASRQLPDVIVTELILPDVRGYFAAQIRRSLTRAITVIAVTRLSPMIFAAARNAGFDEVLAKPVDLRMLRERIERALVVTVTAR